MEKYINQIVKGDCIESLKKLPDHSVDLIFADPPYNLQLKKDLMRPNQTKVEGVFDKWDQFSSFKVYDEFTEAWLKESRRVLKKNGAIWVIGSYHNIFRVGAIMQNLGFWFLNDVIWVKTNPMPNFRGTRFQNAHETMIWASRAEKSSYTFHYKSMKAFNDDLQMRSDWWIPICSGKERLKVDGKKVHSTQKPEELLFRVILSSTNVGDVVLDPFSGSGTTAAVAKKLGRNFIGLEREDYYIEHSRKRIEAIEPLDLEDLNYLIEKKPPKVPFGNLIEKEMVQVGELLFDKKEQNSARIAANATLEWEGKAGSIHKISATILGKSANNGWKYWYVKRGEELILIDELRSEYIKKYY